MVEREDNLLHYICGRKTKKVEPTTFKEEESGIESYNFWKEDKPDVTGGEILLIA